MINNDEPRTWPFEVLRGVRLEGLYMHLVAMALLKSLKHDTMGCCAIHCVPEGMTPGTHAQ